MTTKELILLLQPLDPEAELYLSADEEGNAICPADELVEIRTPRQSYYTLYPVGVPLDLDSESDVTVFPL